jgi:hypothetical protein
MADMSLVKMTVQLDFSSVKMFLPKDTLPKDILPNGHFGDGRFAERTFCRTDILLNGQFCRKDNLPKIEMVQRMTHLLGTCFDVRT